MDRQYHHFRSSKDRNSSSFNSKHYVSHSGRSNFSYDRYYKGDTYHSSSSSFRKSQDKSLMAGQNLRTPKWDLSRLHPIKKSLYQEHPLVTSRDESIIEEQRKEFKILTQGHIMLKPIRNFAESNLPDTLVKILTHKFSGPTPIQSQAWPLALSGLDLVGIARTGSGKTLAYLLPGLIHIKAQVLIVNHEPIFLVLTPTRELALQVQAVCLEYAALLQLNSCCIYGGSPKGNQIRELERGSDIVVATPGRLLDLLEMRKIYLDKVSFCVLDEADRMLDMGFEPQIRKIMEQLRPDKQMLMWSATWPKDVKSLAEDFLTNYVQIYIGSIELSANHNISQNFEFCEEPEKSTKLLELLNRLMRDKQRKTIVFCETKRKVKSITLWLQRVGFYVDCIHGDKEQFSRENVLSAFRQGKILILVATDVASRGLDIAGIQNIINLDFPNVAEDYIHRIGRTARADNSGFAYTFFTSQNYKHSNELIRILREANQNIPPKLYEINKDFRPFSRKRFRDFENPAVKHSRYSNQYNKFTKGDLGAKPTLPSQQNYNMPHRNVIDSSQDLFNTTYSETISKSYQPLSNPSVQLPVSMSFQHPPNPSLQLSSNTSIQVPLQENLNQNPEWNVRMNLDASFIPPVFQNDIITGLQTSFPVERNSYRLEGNIHPSQFNLPQNISNNRNYH